MRIKHLPLLACLSLLVSCSDKKAGSTPAAGGTALPPATVSFPNYGFSISSLDTTERANVFQALDMQVAPMGSPVPLPRISVQLQSYNGTLGDYMKQMRDDFSKMGVNIVRESAPTPNEATIEYMAFDQNGLLVRWYTHLVQSDKIIYMAVGMALDLQWTGLGDRVKACINSLALSANAPAGDTVGFPNYGFRIAPFDLPLNNWTVQPLFMALPPENGFSPNVNVQIQPISANIETFATEAARLIKERNQNVLNQRFDGNSWQVEYMGGMTLVSPDQQFTTKTFRWYARAIAANGRIYLATGGVPDEMWTKYGAALKACVDSFKVTGTALVAAPPPEQPSAAPANGTAAPAGNATATPAANGTTAPATP